MMSYNTFSLKLTKIRFSTVFYFSLATFLQIYVGDIRQPGMLYAVFSKHQGVVNSIDFASKTLFNLVSGGKYQSSILLKLPKAIISKKFLGCLYWYTVAKYP